MDGARTAERLASGDAAGPACALHPTMTWARLFSRVLVERVEPNLGFGRATVL
jgi:lysyl-tRNA synthetase class 2